MAKDNESKLPAQRAQDSPPLASGKLCQRCRTQNAQDAKYCTQCGDRLSREQCPHCGKQNVQAAQFCTNCGNPLPRQQPAAMYARYGPHAEKIKISLQMIVGVILTAFIIVYIIYRASYAIVLAIFPTLHIPLLDVSPLTIVGVALAISTAFELAYTLFTDGPDEAVNPVITGVAAGILLLISPNLAFSGAGAVALLALALVVLFILKAFFIENKEWIHRLGGKLPSGPTSKGNET